MNMEQTLTVKSTFGIDIKRFDIPAGSTYLDLQTTLFLLYKKDNLGIRYKDEDNDLIALTSEEEFTEALKSVPKTGNILRLYLDESKGKAEAMKRNKKQKVVHKEEVPLKSPTEDIEKPDKSHSSASIPTAQRKSNTACPRIKWRKIESASKLSKDVIFNNSEVTGREPVKPQCNDEALHLSSQKPGYRKARRVSSSNANNDKSEKKTSRGRPDKRQHKRKRQSISSSSSSSDRSSSGSSSSSSESSSEDERRCNRVNRSTLKKTFEEFEKDMMAKVNKVIADSKDEIKKELTPQIIQDMLLRLDGAVIQSIPQNSSPSHETSAVPRDGQRARYHHQNVICDVCQNEIFGPRYKCGNCSDYDLCESCEQIEGIHTPSHVFLKINYPSVHCGRRSISGKARPLLSTNIYEEREKEREREELLQRKLDSGSELSVKKVEKMEKQRLKRKEAERTRENKEARREEWRNLKRELKELKKRKKEIKKKVKKHVKVYKNEKRAENVAEEVSCEVITKTSDSTTLQDENLSKALSGLKFVQSCTEDKQCEKLQVEEVVEATESHQLESLESPKLESLVLVEPIQVADDGNLSDASEKTDSDVIVVPRDSLQPMDVISDQMSNVDLSKKPDLVDFDTDVAESVASEDFIVVSKYFDLSVPLDDKAIAEHQLFHESNGTTCDDTCLNDAYPMLMQPATVGSSEQLPVDLVASVPEPPVQSAVQPDIALSTTPSPPGEVTMVRNDDDVIQNNSVTMATQVSTSETDNNNAQVSFTTNSVVDGDTVTTTTTTSVVSKQPESCDVISTQPTLHEEILSLKQNVDVIDIQPATTEKPKTLLQQAEGLQNSTPETENAASADSNATACEEKTAEQVTMETETLKFNPPSEKFMKDMHNQRVQESTNSQTATTTTTTSSDGTTLEVSSTRPPSFAGVITDVIGSVVDVAASAASAIGVTNNPKTPAPQAHYTNSTVTFDYKQEDHMLQHLKDMGFCDRQFNLSLLKKHNGDISKCVEELLRVNDADWYQTRH